MSISQVPTEINRLYIVFLLGIHEKHIVLREKCELFEICERRRIGLRGFELSWGLDVWWEEKRFWIRIMIRLNWKKNVACYCGVKRVNRLLWYVMCAVCSVNCKCAWEIFFRFSFSNELNSNSNRRKIQKWDKDKLNRYTIYLYSHSVYLS